MKPAHTTPLWQRIPWALVFVALLIPLLGVLNIASAAQVTRPGLPWVQLGWIGAGLCVASVVVWTQTRTIEWLAYPAYAVVCVLLVAVLFADPIKGSRRWIPLGFFNLQPSELAKLAILLVTARYFSRYRAPGGYTLRDLIRPLNPSRPALVLLAVIGRVVKSPEKAEATLEALSDKLTPVGMWVVLGALVLAWGFWVFLVVLSWKSTRRSPQRLIAPIDVVLIGVGLVIIEPDLGTSLVILAMAGAQILFVGVRKKSLAIAVSVAVGTSVLGWNVLLQPYQKKRVEDFLNPEADVQGAGYQGNQSRIAIGSGGLTGKGYGEGTQTQLSFLPENHTDFVFSVLCEEWGLLGGSVLIALFFLLIALILREGMRARTRFAALVCVGSAAMIFWHVLLNIGMVTGLAPVVGSALPFVSYGGSSMITQMVCVALVVNMSVWRRRSA